MNKNRGWILKLLKIATDFNITGKLKGQIFPEDTLFLKEINFPFCANSDNTLYGSIFQKDGWDIFPMLGVHKKKQK